MSTPAATYGARHAYADPWGSSLLRGFDFHAVAGSVAAHAVVAALLVMTWSESPMLERAARSSIVSIDLDMHEGAQAASASPSARSRDADKAPVRHTVEPERPPSQAAEQRDIEKSQPADAAAAGKGRSGTGTAVLTRPAPIPPRVVPVNAMELAPPVFVTPSPESHGASASGRSGVNDAPAGTSVSGNFKGRIYQHLLRHRRGNTIGSGKTLVGFTIAPDGSASGIVVARGSGSARFDREALQLVRRASPFPRPPDGAAHSFTFEISGQ